MYDQNPMMAFYLAQALKLPPESIERYDQGDIGTGLDRK